MLRVGLTGGIACGKSHVLARWAAAGFHTLDLDRVAHDVMAPGGSAYAEVVALSIPRGAANPNGAFTVAGALTSQAPQAALSGILGTPSVRRDTAPGNGADPYATVFRNASLSAFSFFDPDPSASDAIFQKMVENVTSGRFQVSQATQSANQDLSALLGTH